MATIGDIKSGLNQAKAEAEKALAQLAAVNAQVDQAIAVLRALTAGTNQPAVMSAIGKLESAKQRFNEGGTAIRSAVASTDAYNAVL